MARAERRQAARQARQVQRRPRAAAGGARVADETMFFPKLRSHAKWVFVVLAVLFMMSFVFLGVGSGSTGLGDLLQGNWGSLFSSNSGASAQVKKDRKRIQQNPKDYAAYRDLATALNSDGKTDEAIATLEKLRSIHPKDSEGLSQLAQLYLAKGQAAQNQAAALQGDETTLVGPSNFTPASTSKLGQAYQSLNDPIVNAVQNQSNAKFQNAYSKMTTAYSQAVSAYKEVAKLTPNDPQVQVALATTAEAANDLPTAIAAFKRVLKLAPDDANAAVIRQRIKQLQQQAGPVATSGTSGSSGG
jgi:tetratricopeptide (TPR) repeat protein